MGSIVASKNGTVESSGDITYSWKTNTISLPILDGFSSQNYAQEEMKIELKDSMGATQNYTFDVNFDVEYES